MVVLHLLLSRLELPASLVQLECRASKATLAKLEHKEMLDKLERPALPEVTVIKAGRVLRATRAGKVGRATLATLELMAMMVPTEPRAAKVVRATRERSGRRDLAVQVGRKVRRGCVVLGRKVRRALLGRQVLEHVSQMELRKQPHRLFVILEMVIVVFRIGQLANQSPSHSMGLPILA
jgi:hypothetical protein